MNVKMHIFLNIKMILECIQKYFKQEWVSFWSTLPQFSPHFDWSSILSRASKSSSPPWYLSLHLCSPHPVTVIPSLLSLWGYRLKSSCRYRWLRRGGFKVTGIKEGNEDWDPGVNGRLSRPITLSWMLKTINKPTNKWKTDVWSSKMSGSDQGLGRQQAKRIQNDKV